jgi:hypothetical protein
VGTQENHVATQFYFFQKMKIKGVPSSPFLVGKWKSNNRPIVLYKKKLKFVFLLPRKHSGEPNGCLIFLLPDFPLEKNFKFFF